MQIASILSSRNKLQSNCELSIESLLVIATNESMENISERHPLILLGILLFISFSLPGNAAYFAGGSFVGGSRQRANTY